VVLAQKFLGFFEKFTDTFALHDKKIYITGESYAGQYIPYFAEAMLNANDTKHFDLTGTMIIDGVLNELGRLDTGKIS
jgi:carboxypeptidase D